MNKVVKSAGVCVMFFLAGVLGGCGTSQQLQEDIVWPAPPDEARIKYVKTYHSEDDFLSGMGKTIQMLAGQTPTIALRRPFDVCSDDAGTVYVSDVSQGLVAFSEKKQEVRFIGDKLQLPLDSPLGIAFGNGKLFVGLVDAGQVVVLGSEDQFINVIGRPNQFPNPVDVAYDHVGKRVIIVDNKLQQVLVYSESGDSLFALGVPGERSDVDGEFNAPQSAAVDSRGNIYIVDAFNFRVQVFSPEGTFLRKYGQQGSGFGMFNRPKGIALDTYDNIYIVDALHNNFQIFNANFDLLMFVGRYSTIDNKGFLNPIGIHIDTTNRIYVADQVNQRVQIFQLLKAE